MTTRTTKGEPEAIADMRELLRAYDAREITVLGVAFGAVWFNGLVPTSEKGTAVGNVAISAAPHVKHENIVRTLRQELDRSFAEAKAMISRAKGTQ